MATFRVPRSSTFHRNSGCRLEFQSHELVQLRRVSICWTNATQNIKPKENPHFFFYLWSFLALVDARKNRQTPVSLHDRHRACACWLADFIYRNPKFLISPHGTCCPLCFAFLFVSVGEMKAIVTSFSFPFSFSLGKSFTKPFFSSFFFLGALRFSFFFSLFFLHTSFHEFLAPVVQGSSILS